MRMDTVVIGMAALTAGIAAAVILIRTLRFVPNKERIPREEKVTLDEQRIVQDMQKMIRCRTVSYQDPALIDQEEFRRFVHLLSVLYPAVHRECARYTVCETTQKRMTDCTKHQAFQAEDKQLRCCVQMDASKTLNCDAKGLLFRWKGKNAEEPMILMAHYDVVPAREEQWEKPPFAGIVEQGVLWGRGTLDTKGTVCGILEAAEKLISEGYVPQRDIYFAFSGQEEIAGPACSAIVDWFEAQGIHPYMVLDEGGAVVEHVFPGVGQPCAVIGVAEKGMVNIEFRAKSGGGHASTPPVHTIVGQLAKAVTQVEAHPFRGQLTKPVREMLDTLGRHSTFGYRMVFANLWCFRGLLDWICKKAGGELNAMIRTTCAVTRMEGSRSFNVLPPAASIGMNLRLLGKDTPETAKDYLERVIRDPQIETVIVEGRVPSPDSDTSCDAWEGLCQIVTDTWPGALVSPYLMMACSDSWHYSRISDRVYRFSAMKLSKEEREMIHGVNERVSTETLVKTAEFYVRLMQHS